MNSRNLIIPTAAINIKANSHPFHNPIFASHLKSSLLNYSTSKIITVVQEIWLDNTLWPALFSHIRHE